MTAFLSKIMGVLGENVNFDLSVGAVPVPKKQLTLNF